MREESITRIAAKQFGIVTRAQLLAAGLSSSAIGRHVATGLLVRLYAGVYAVGHTAIKREGRALAAQLACGEAAALGLEDAAAYMGLMQSGSAVWHILVPGRGTRCHPGIRAHRITCFAPGEVVTDGPIRHTSLARTALDMAATRPERRVRRLLRDAEIQRVFDLRALHAVLDRHHGRPGTVALRAVLSDLEPVQPNEGFEDDFLEFVRDRRLRRPELQVPMGPYWADFYWRAERVVVETNDFASHGIRSSFEHDNERAAWFAARHIAVVPVTARRLARDPGGIERDLLAALGSSAP